MIDQKKIEEWKADRDTVLGSALACCAGTRVERVAEARDRLVTAAVCLLREREEMIALLREVHEMLEPADEIDCRLSMLLKAP